ncbi:DnaJ domain-containing protein [Plasmodium falciparum IGH-CR14]|uniref:DnaJ domain-containing protein n=1 Tax=Plasmodium falciparum IGH-CR14 TaxID=580059 RepID=A0A0L1IFJ7_PLAFA|nr:DnaJ domain-containing protein [Plasmodium falciparum IGH-CR14]
MNVTNVVKRRKKLSYFHSLLLIIFSFFLSCARGMDYYKRLGVKRNATKEDISKAYRQLAKEYHPDIAPDKEKDFIEIANAYETLSDPEKRKMYDMYGEDYAQGGMGGGNVVNEIFKQFAGGGGAGASGGRAGNFHFKFTSGGPSFNHFEDEYEDIYKNEVLKINF